MSTKNQFIRLRDQIKKYNKSYYNSKPDITDTEFDKLKDKYEEIINKNSLLKKFDERITKDIFNILNAEKSVIRKTSEGGTSPKNVKRAAGLWLKRLKDEK